MKKHTFRTLVFVGIASIVAVACSKKNSTPTPTPINNLPQTLTVKPGRAKNGGFSISTPYGFIANINFNGTDDSTIQGDIYKYGSTVGDSIKLNFSYGIGYGGLVSADTIAARTYYANMGNTVLSVEKFSTDNFNPVVLVSYLENKEFRMNLSAFNSVAGKHNLNIYSQYANREDQKALIKSMMITVKYIP